MGDSPGGARLATASMRDATRCRARGYWPLDMVLFDRCRVFDSKDQSHRCLSGDAVRPRSKFSAKCGQRVIERL